MSQHKVALIMGASRGLGLVIARLLAERKFSLVIGARNHDELDHAAGSLKVLTPAVIPVDGDVTDPSVRTRLIEAARGLGGLDLLVNNASELGGIGRLMNF